MAAKRSNAAVARAAAERFRTLVEIMQALRAPGGCPWDRKQTYETLRPFVLEETYEVLEQWEQIKAREQKTAGEAQSLLKGVPRALPSLLRSHEIGSRVAAVGFDWPTPTDVVLKIEEEVRELREAVDKGDRRHAGEEMGDLLFSIANLARKLGIEPESALREANEKFTRRFQALERKFEEDQRPLSKASLEEMEDVWRTVKHVTAKRAKPSRSR